MRSLFIFIFMLGFSSVYCQTTDKSGFVWISFGQGLLGTDAPSGMSLYASADLSINRIIKSTDKTKLKNNSYKIRFLKYTEFVNEEFRGRINEFDVLYGKTYGKKIQLNISGGMGIIRYSGLVSTSNGPFFPPTLQNKTYHTFNLPLELGVILVPLKVLGLGIAGYANINSRKPKYGLVLKLELGKIR